ncbi:hypothetical protein BC937DRAFT_90616 [Endogone sp. FLAS-F59071]|nr:hypothetical protein BC937DRAFT_90616 [Endogone sp. FLAS-F59071]|eukprot:RUS22028.1 hypothetical protein BC937DRAFT_90616 [Endogone sp. FLAS-F59071]
MGRSTRWALMTTISEISPKQSRANLIWHKITKCYSFLDLLLPSFTCLQLKKKSYTMPTIEGLSHFTLTASTPESYADALVFYSALGFQSVAMPQGESKEVWLTLFGTFPGQDLTVKLWINPDRAPKKPLSRDKEWRLEESSVAVVTGDIETLESALQTLSCHYQKHTPTPPTSNPLSVPLTTSKIPTEIYTLDPLNNLITFTNMAHPLSKEVLDRTIRSVVAPSTIPSGHATRRKRIGVLTSGGDSPGMNASVRAVVRVGIARGCEVYGIYEGYQGLLEGGNKIKKMNWDDVRGFLHMGGTVIGTARCMEFRERPGRLQSAENLIKNGIDALIVCGGDGSLTGADIFRAEWPNLLEELVSTGRCTAEEVEPFRTLSIVGLVGSIDNDMASTDITIGAVTSLHRICESVDSISSTAMSHSRAFVIEVMGRHCGWLALMAGISCGADQVFIPEHPPVEDDWESSMCEHLQNHRLLGKRKSIVIVAEGAIDKHLNPIKPDYIKDVLAKRLGLDTRVTTLGHVQRGGAPAAFDRYLGTVQGVEAVEAVLRFNPDVPSPMIGMCQNQLTWKPLMKAVELTHEVAKAIKAKDFKRAMELRDPEFVEAYDAFISSTAVDNQLIKLPEHERLRIGILHIGAPAGGMNTATRIAVRFATNRGHTPLGIYNGFPGLIKGSIEPFSWLSVDGWTTRGGSELGTNREQPDIDMGMVAYQLQKNNIQGLLLVGGFEAYTALLSLEDARKVYPALNIPMVHIPATVSNNVPGTDFSLGSDTSLNAIVGACDAIVQSASASRRRVFVVEVQGGKTGYLGVMGGLATGATTVYIPETGVSLAMLQHDVQHLIELYNQDDPNRSEGRIILRTENVSKTYTTDVISNIITTEGQKLFDSRTAVLGHIQQGGTPSPLDRIRATRQAVRCVRFIEEHAIPALDEAHASSSLPPAALCGSAESAAVIGIRGSEIVFTPARQLLKETDMKNRKNTKSWWLSMKGLVDLLSKKVNHDGCEEEYCSALERVDRIIGKLDPPKRY